MSDDPYVTSSHPHSDPSQSLIRLQIAPTDTSHLQAPADIFNPLCASARTSYTRVDINSGSGTGANTPRMSCDPMPGLTIDPDAIHTDADVDADEQEQEHEQEHEQEQVPQTPQVGLTFLLVSGRRRSMAFDPETAVGRVKELVWNSWPNGTSSSLAGLRGATSLPIFQFHCL